MGWMQRIHAEDVSPEYLSTFLKQAPGQAVCGLNVTLPHKEDALRLSSSSSDVQLRGSEPLTR